MCKGFLNNLLGGQQQQAGPAKAEATEYEAGGDVRDTVKDTSADPMRRSGSNIAGVADSRKRRGALAGLGL